MKPYLTPELDALYQISASRQFILWGEVTYRGQAGAYNLRFRKHGYYPIAQADGDAAVEISVTLPRHYRQLMDGIPKHYLIRWLPEAHRHLLEHKHDFLEYWKGKGNSLSLIVVWYRESPDWTVIPNCVQRLINVADVIQSFDSNV